MASITALGHSLPPQAIHNNDLACVMDTSDEWISQRSGIRERRWIRKGAEQFSGLANHEMAYQAALKALNGDTQKASAIDAILYATVSPDDDLPGSGTLLKEKLGISAAIPIVEVRNQCAGFLFALNAARAYVDGGAFRSVLVIGGEIQSSGLDLSSEGRGTSVLFADGCGAALVAPDQADGHKILGAELHSDGRFADKLCVASPGFAVERLICAERFAAGDKQLFPHMEGRFIFHMASQKMPEVVRSVLKNCGYDVHDLALIVPHQANQRILDMLSAEFGGKIRVFSNIARYGNTTSASIPIALSEARDEGVLGAGDLVCLTTFGSGVSWGALLLRW